MGRVGDIVKGWKPGVMMVMVQIIGAGLNIFYKLAFNNGMSLKILVAYRFLFSSAFIIPLALYVDRKSRPKLTKMVLGQAFVSALLAGPLGQNLYTQSLVLTSATFASAIINLNPLITFIIVVLFRMERLKIGTIAGKAQVVGTLLGIGGTMILPFFKGAEINIWSSHINLLHNNHHVASSHHHSTNYVLGFLLAVAAAVSASISLIIQGKMSRRYPCHYSSTALISFIATFQFVIFALCIERDWAQWKLGWNIGLLTVTYGGIMGTALVNTIMMACVRMRGPLFVSIFSPLLLVTVAIAGSLVLGVVTIISGLYLVLWAKGKEMKKASQVIKPTVSPQEFEGGVLEIPRNSSTKSLVVVVDPNSHQIIEQRV